MTYFIYKQLYNEDLTKKNYPKTTNSKSKIIGKEFIEFNSAIWKAKKDAGLSLKDPIKKATAPLSLKNAEIEIKAMHNIPQLTFNGNETEIKVEAK